MTNEEILNLFDSGNALRPRDIERLGGTRLQLQRLHERGLLERPTRGVYVSATAELPAQQSLIEVALRLKLTASRPSGFPLGLHASIHCLLNSV